jgi:hypothetical protein
MGKTVNKCLAVPSFRHSSDPAGWDLAMWKWVEETDCLGMQVARASLSLGCDFHALTKTHSYT